MRMPIDNPHRNVHGIATSIMLDKMTRVLSTLQRIGQHKISQDLPEEGSSQITPSIFLDPEAGESEATLPAG
jgi:hypothetical protein